MKIETQISIIKPELESLIETYDGQIEELIDKIQKLTEISSNFSHNWVGTWATNSYNHYRDHRSNGVVIQIDADSIQKYIEKESGLTIKEIKQDVNRISKAYREFQDRIVTELSFIKMMETLSPEIDLIKKIESYKWGISPSEYVDNKTPARIITYDPFLINNGLDIPPHLTIDGKIISLFSTLAAAKDFQKICTRLLRQLEIKFQIDSVSYEKTDFILKILNSFHDVATQIRNRYNKRDTLIISDEYDIQDLLHGLLRIEFDDIRPEEYTPSYAGSSTRMDFLLKKEKTVIEVKKTRNGLKDKEVGDQLILDSQHYKIHPDCKRLICFVYDPENRIENPRGLETDLNALTTDNLIIEVYIRP